MAWRMLLRPSVAPSSGGAGRPRSAGSASFWLVELDLALDRSLRWCSSDERSRIKVLRHAEDKLRFASGRAAVRLILSSELGVPARTLLFERRPCVWCGGAHGKPVVGGQRSVSFSHATSGGFAAIARATEMEIGVDVERIRSVAVGEIGKTMLAPSEMEKLDRLSGEQRLQAFFQIWTRKEAYVKATGRGLGDDLRALDLSTDARSGRRVLPSSSNPRILSEWIIHTMDAPVGYQVAVAAECSQLELDFQVVRLSSLVGGLLQSRLA